MRYCLVLKKVFNHASYVRNVAGRVLALSLNKLAAEVD
jgi:hypothetical protein